MSTKYNQLYNNPALTRAFSNIANTLIGSASGDADIARANYLNSQTRGQNLKNENMQDLRKSIEPTTNVLASNILRSFTGQPNAQFNQSGVPIVDGGNMSMPVSGNINVMPPADMTKENYSNVARTMLGDLTFKPNQFASALNTLGQSEREKLAQNLITSGNADDKRAGFSLLGKSPGQFFDSGSAKYATDKKTEVGLDKNQKVFDIGKYKFDNRDISIAVGKDKQVFLDAATGKKLGIPPQTIDGKEVYVLDGKQSPNKVVVKVGKSDVYLNKETADALGVPKKNGKYVIKGKGFADGSGGGSGGSGSKSGMKPTDVKNTLANLKTTYEQFTNYTENLPQAVIGNVEKEIINMMKKDMDDGISRDQAFINNARGVISQGATLIDSPIVGKDLYAPTFFVNYFKRSNATIDQITKQFVKLGYNKDQAQAIAEFIKPSD
tara:strand:+ start:5563 stop:6876 length:1314 start_codon:yes stop_codon:yes gene_type:complete